MFCSPARLARAALRSACAVASARARRHRRLRRRSPAAGAACARRACRACVADPRTCRSSPAPRCAPRRLRRPAACACRFIPASCSSPDTPAQARLPVRCRPGQSARHVTRAALFPHRCLALAAPCRYCGRRTRCACLVRRPARRVRPRPRRGRRREQGARGGEQGGKGPMTVGFNVVRNRAAHSLLQK